MVSKPMRNDCLGEMQFLPVRSALLELHLRFRTESVDTIKCWRKKEKIKKCRKVNRKKSDL